MDQLVQQRIERERHEWTQIGRATGFKVAYYHTLECETLGAMRQKLAGFAGMKSAHDKAQEPASGSLTQQAEAFARAMKQLGAVRPTETAEERDNRIAAELDQFQDAGVIR